VAMSANVSFSYRPAANSTLFPYSTLFRSDGTTSSNVATVSFTITPVNDPPVAVNDAYSTAEDTALAIAAPGVLANDSDVDGDAHTAVPLAGTPHSTLALNANGSFSYTPAA